MRKHFDFQIQKFVVNYKKLIDDGRKLKLKFIGTVSHSIKEAMQMHGLEPSSEYLAFAIKEMLTELINADYLLVCATEPRHVQGNF
jgi:hypothetical protein